MGLCVGSGRSCWRSSDFRASAEHDQARPSFQCESLQDILKARRDPLDGYALSSKSAEFGRRFEHNGEIHMAYRAQRCF